MKVGDLVRLVGMGNNEINGDLALILEVTMGVHVNVYRCMLQKTGERTLIYGYHLEKIP